MAHRVPADPELLRIAEAGEPRLLGSFSPAAGKTFFPRRKRCPITLEPVEDCELSTRGVLYSWTFVVRPVLGSQELAEEGGYGVGQIDLPEGVRVQAPIAGAMGDWEIGMPMALALLPVGKGAEGEELVTFHFVPETSGGGRA